MKKLFLPLLILLPWQLFAQPICNAAGNLAVFSNYDGGILTINVDQNIPNSKNWYLHLRTGSGNHYRDHLLAM